jgi:hypothetical protein
MIHYFLKLICDTMQNNNNVRVQSNGQTIAVWFEKNYLFDKEKYENLFTFPYKSGKQSHYYFMCDTINNFKNLCELITCTENCVTIDVIKEKSYPNMQRVIVNDMVDAYENIKKYIVENITDFNEKFFLLSDFKPKKPYDPKNWEAILIDFNKMDAKWAQTVASFY